MNRSASASRDIASLKTQIKELQMRKPFLNEILKAFSQLLIAGAQVRAALETLPDPKIIVSASERFSAGLPLLSGVAFRKRDLPPTAGVESMLTVVRTAFPSLKGDVDRLRLSLDKTPDLPAQWLGILLENRESRLEAEAEPLGLEPETFRFALEQALKPFLQWLAGRLSGQVEQIRWDRGYCPVCGARPDTSYLRKHFRNQDYLTGHGSRRWLHCSRCSFEWRLHRVVCPHCGNEDAETLEYLASTENPHEKLYVCHHCKKYLPCLDTSELIEAPMTDLIPFELLHLDVLATEKGFSPAVRTGTVEVCSRTSDLPPRRP